MRKWLVVVTVPGLLASPALARDQDRPITDREPGVMDVARTPINDLNLSRTEIPALLVEAEKRPYVLQNLGKCDQIAAAVEELNGVLGPDIDLPQDERARFSEGRIAQWAIGRFIPFRSLIREISGANKQERAVAAAIQAGLARRGFLKGVGAARGCKYPASPATESIIAKQAAAAKTNGKDADTRIEPQDVDAAPAKPAQAMPAPKPKPTFTSEPVIQPTR